MINLSKHWYISINTIQLNEGGNPCLVLRWRKGRLFHFYFLPFFEIGIFSISNVFIKLWPVK